MKIFWLLLLLLWRLDLAFLKNVEIIEDSPPNIIPINASFVHIDFENSVVIKNFSLINKLVLNARNSGSNYGISYYIVARATRDKDPFGHLFTRVYNKQKLVKGNNFVAAMYPCEKYSAVKLDFYSDKEIVDTSYEFEEGLILEAISIL